MITIGTRPIGREHPPFVIAEMSGNHNGDLGRALALVDAAAEAGADALKLQTATPGGLTLDVDRPEFRIDDPRSPWHGRHLYELYQDAVTPWEWHGPLFERARERGLVAFSSPFEAGAVDLLESLGAPCHKIASFELVDLGLVTRAAATGKPLIMSTGMASVSDIERAVRAARDAGNDQLVLLKCTSTYPATPENSNVRTIPHLREMFGTEVGLSDHTMGVGVPCAAVAMGATVIEKHFTLARADGGVDASFSLEPHELAALVVEVRRAWEGLGAVRYGGVAAEKAGAVQYRRSLYVAEDVAAGEALTERNLRVVRPGAGLSPEYLGILLGKRVNRALTRGTPMSWDFIG